MSVPQAAAQDDCFASPFPPAQSELTATLDRALQGKNLEQELATAQALSEQYLACVRTGEDEHTCGQQADPNYGQ